MLKKDIMIGIIGATILVAAMVGVFRYEASRATGSAFEVEWESLTLAGPGESGTLQDGQEAQVQLDISQQNLTAVSFVLTWTDDVANSDPDEFELVVVSPEGEEKRASASNGRFEVTFDDLTVQPSPQTVLAGSEADARRQLASQASETGTGTWSVTVRLVEAGNLEPAPGVVVQEDNANGWDLETQLKAYDARLTPR